MLLLRLTSHPSMPRGVVLFGRASSLNTQRVLWALHEVAIPFTLQQTSATIGASGRLDGSEAYGGTDEPEFLRCSPFRQIPALHDGCASHLLPSHPPHPPACCC